MGITEIIWSVIVGVLTGCASSWIVSLLFEKKASKREVHLRVNQEKQELYQYLLHLFDELIIVQKRRDVSRLIWILGAKPFSDYLTQAGKKEFISLLDEIDKLLDEISTFCFSRIDDEPFEQSERNTLTVWANTVISLSEKVKLVAE